MSGMRRLLMYSRPGCGLCDEMYEQLEPWQGKCGLEFSVVNIDADPALQERFGLRVPVLFLDGVELCFGRLDADLLDEALQSR